MVWRKTGAKVVRKPWSDRGSRHARGYGSGWVRLRSRVLKRDRYLCAECFKQGRPTKATEVDHIQPKADGGTDHMSNLQSLCRECHDRKTARDNGRVYRAKTEIGEDGWPK